MSKKKKKVDKYAAASAVALGLSVVSTAISWVADYKRQELNTEKAVEKYCKKNGWRIYKG